MVALGNIHIGFALSLLISRCLSNFHSLWVAKANMISGGIWALYCKCCIVVVIHIVKATYTGFDFHRKSCMVVLTHINSFN